MMKSVICDAKMAPQNYYLLKEDMPLMFILSTALLFWQEF